MISQFEMLWFVAADTEFNGGCDNNDCRRETRKYIYDYATLAHSSVSFFTKLLSFHLNVVAALNFVFPNYLKIPGSYPSPIIGV